MFRQRASRGADRQQLAEHLPVSSSEELALSLRAVRAACHVTRALQDELPEDLQPRKKADRSPVTVADFAAQAAVGRILGAPFVGEEKAEPLENDEELRRRVLAAARVVDRSLTETQLMDAVRLGEARPDHRSFWTLDPVDGTKGFLRRAHYCVSLAWLEDGAPVVGVLGAPRMGSAAGEVEGTGALFWARRNDGTFVAPLDFPEQSTTIRTPTPSGRIRIAESAEAAHSDHSLGPALLRRLSLESDAPVRLDSQIKYAVVARGDAHVFLRKPRDSYVERIWDHAAGSLVASEAGCRVTDLMGEPLDFSHGVGLEQNRGLLVAPPVLHRELLTGLKE